MARERMAPNGERRPRVAVVGGGLAGVSLAYLLDGACDVRLYEKERRLGGHAHTVTVEHRGQRFQVDLGAQLFSPRLQPVFVALLERLGIYDPRAPDSGGTITREMGITPADNGAARPRFVSPMLCSR
jgi:predicted NAD/FAD-binding protein